MVNKTLQYITTICFALIAVKAIIDCFGNFSLGGLVYAVGSVLVVIAILNVTTKLSTVGFGVIAISVLYSLVLNLKTLMLFEPSFLLLFVYIVDLIVYIFLMIAGIYPKSAKTLGIISAILAIIDLALMVISNSVVEGFQFVTTTILSKVLLIVGAILLGLTYDSISKMKAQEKLESNKTERLIYLKSLLDKGIITKEEFDAKKKQLLGL